jgi:hypothetical protein
MTTKPQTPEQMKAEREAAIRQDQLDRETRDKALAAALAEAYAPFRKALNALVCDAESRAGREYAKTL